MFTLFEEGRLSKYKIILSQIDNITAIAEQIKATHT